MSNERDVGGNVRELLVKARHAAGLNLSELASQADVSRSRLHAAEAGTSLPTMEVCLKLGRVLNICPSRMARAHIEDAVHIADPSALATVRRQLWGSNPHWEAIAEHHGLRIEHGVSVATVNEDGDVTLRRQYTGCMATRPRRRVVFRDRIVGERAPSFAVKGSPGGLGYAMEVSIEGEWVEHRVEFRRPWTGEDGGFDFEFETEMPKAYVLDVEQYTRRRRSEGLVQGRETWGDYRSHVSYAFESLELAITFPKGYAPPWDEPTATWGSAPIDDADYYEVHPRTCLSSKLETARDEAKLILERPAPGYTFGIRWKPVAWAPGGEGEES